MTDQGYHTPTQPTTIPQPVVRGRVSTVDGSAREDMTKIVVWAPRDSAIQVEIRTLRRMQMVSWESEP